MGSGHDILKLYLHCTFKIKRHAIVHIMNGKGWGSLTHPYLLLVTAIASALKTNCLRILTPLLEAKVISLKAWASKIGNLVE